MNISEDVLKQKITESLNLFMNHHGYLVEIDVSERAITHKIAEAFEGMFGASAGYDVDCEYNRVRGHRIKCGNNGRRVYPDIVIHRRGQQNDNILAVEVKKRKAGTKAIIRDQKKLEEYVRGQLRYKYGLSVVFRVGIKPRYECKFFDGNLWTELANS
jgi:hypothetical protein